MENSKAIHFPSHLPAGLRQSPAILPADDRGGGGCVVAPRAVHGQQTHVLLN